VSSGGLALGATIENLLVKHQKNWIGSAYVDKEPSG
jgi:hypothetical protein